MPRIGSRFAQLQFTQIPAASQSSFRISRRIPLTETSNFEVCWYETNKQTRTSLSRVYFCIIQIYGVISKLTSLMSFHARQSWSFWRFALNAPVAILGLFFCRLLFERWQFEVGEHFSKHITNTWNTKHYTIT